MKTQTIRRADAHKPPICTKKGAEVGLSPEPPRNETPSSYLFNPDHPVPTMGGRYARAPAPCAQDQVCSPKILGCSNNLPLNRREDVLSFSTTPLESPLEVTGKLRAFLWISSDAVDTDFTTKLMDVYPNGYALILNGGRIRTRYRESPEKPVFMKPGTPYRVEIDLGSTSNLFGRGHTPIRR